jgi:hypothetical protein
MCRCALLVVLTVTGCGSQGPRKYRVTGEASWNGEPIPDGYIMLISSDRKIATVAGPIRDGQFELVAFPGHKRIEISATRVTQPAKPGYRGEEREQYIPPRFNQASTLTAEVETHDNNRLSFQLSDKP